MWAYTLVLPAFARSGWLPMSVIADGPAGIALLKPLALFGLSGLGDIIAESDRLGGLVGDLQGGETFLESGRILAANAKLFGAFLNALGSKA